MKAAPSRDPVLPAARSSWGVLVLAAVLVAFLALYVLARPAGSSLLVVNNDTGAQTEVALCSVRTCPDRQLGAVPAHTERAFSLRASPRLVVLVSGAIPRCVRILTSTPSTVIRVSRLRSCTALGQPVAAGSPRQAGHGVPASK